MVEFCERLETAEEIYKGNGEQKHHGKNGSIRIWEPTSQVFYHRFKPEYKTSGRGCKKEQNNQPSCPLNGPGHDMNSYKVMQIQAKSTKRTWSSNCGGGNKSKLLGAKKRLYNVKYLNTLVASNLANAMKMTKNNPKKDNY